MKGKRAKKAVTFRYELEKYVLADVKGSIYYGRVIDRVIEPDPLDESKVLLKYVVKLDDEKKKIKVRECFVRALNDAEQEERIAELEAQEADRKFVKKGFTQYSVNWDKLNIHFAFPTQNVKFNGAWRKRGASSFAIDIYADDGTGKDIAVDCLSYHGEDPREDIDSLNADICAAVNKWFHVNAIKGTMTIEGLRKRADHPVISIRRLESLDRIILRLKEFRDTSCRAGGQRYIVLDGDKPDEPKMTIDLNLTAQAMALDGKVPSLYEGAMYDDVTGKRGEKNRGRVIKHVPDPKNVEELKKLAKAATAAGNKVEARKIRAALRKMGVKGGSRSAS